MKSAALVIAALHLGGFFGRAADPPAGRAVYRFEQKINLSRSEPQDPDSPTITSRYDRVGWLLLDSEVGAKLWNRTLWEYESDSSDLTPGRRSAWTDLDARLRQGRAIAWAPGQTPFRVTSDLKNSDPMGEGTPLDFAALSLPTVLAGLTNDLVPNRPTTNQLRIRFGNRVFSVGYTATLTQEAPASAEIRLIPKKLHVAAAAGRVVFEPSGQWHVDFGRAQLPKASRGSYRLSWRQQWRDDQGPHDVEAFTVENHFSYQLQEGFDFDDDRVFLSSTAPTPTKSN